MPDDNNQMIDPIDPSAGGTTPSTVPDCIYTLGLTNIHRPTGRYCNMQAHYNNSTVKEGDYIYPAVIEVPYKGIDQDGEIIPTIHGTHKWGSEYGVFNYDSGEKALTMNGKMLPPEQFTLRFYPEQATVKYVKVDSNGTRLNTTTSGYPAYTGPVTLDQIETVDFRFYMPITDFIIPARYPNIHVEMGSLNVLTDGITDRLCFKVSCHDNVSHQVYVPNSAYTQGYTIGNQRFKLYIKVKNLGNSGQETILTFPEDHNAYNTFPFTDFTSNYSESTNINPEVFTPYMYPSWSTMEYDIVNNTGNHDYNVEILDIWTENSHIDVNVIGSNPINCN